MPKGTRLAYYEEVMSDVRFSNDNQRVRILRPNSLMAACSHLRGYCHCIIDFHSENDDSYVGCRLWGKAKTFGRCSDAPSSSVSITVETGPDFDVPKRVGGATAPPNSVLFHLGNLLQNLCFSLFTAANPSGL